MKKFLSSVGLLPMGVVLGTGVLHSTLVQTLCASGFIVLGARCSVALYPIPMTMEDWAIMVVALLVPWHVSVGSVLLFLAYGVLGLPVLSSGAVGWAMFAGPTVGYLVGFVLMGGLIAALKGHCAVGGFGMCVGLVLLGNVLLYMTGVGLLTHLLGWEGALRVGLWPFVWAVPVKAVLAVMVARLLSRRL